MEKWRHRIGKNADMLYDLIDASGFYNGTAALGSRSMMNVTFRLPTEELEKSFVQEALATVSAV